MSRKKTDTENIIQSACAHALCVYFDRKEVSYRQLWTYSNQQGAADNKFCADLVGTINSSSLLLMEFKALDHTTGLLPSFKPDQFLVAKAMQKKGIPLIYCYDNYQPLPYNDEPQPKDWPELVLKAINASKPDDLAGIRPRRAYHGHLLDWIEGTVRERPTNLVEAFGVGLGGLTPSMAKNKLISVLYSKQQNEAFMMNENGMKVFFEWLVKLKPHNDTVFQGRIEALKDSLAAGLKLQSAKEVPRKSAPGAKKTAP